MLEKNYYTISYEVVGSRKIDWMNIYAANLAEALEQFKAVEFEVCGYKISYNESAIIRIEIERGRN